MNCPQKVFSNFVGAVHYRISKLDFCYFEEVIYIKYL